MPEQRMPCIIGATGDIERELGDHIADGVLTEGDADQVRRFSEFLTVWGPTDGKPDLDRERRRQDWLETGDNGEFVGLTAEQVAERRVAVDRAIARAEQA